MVELSESSPRSITASFVADFSFSLVYRKKVSNSVSLFFVLVLKASRAHPAIILVFVQEESNSILRR
jgi:hypothetical protein